METGASRRNGVPFRSHDIPTGFLRGQKEGPVAATNIKNPFSVPIGHRGCDKPEASFHAKA
jgi:hypothetical protein